MGLSLPVVAREGEAAGSTTRLLSLGSHRESGCECGCSMGGCGSQPGSLAIAPRKCSGSCTRCPRALGERCEAVALSSPVPQATLCSSLIPAVLLASSCALAIVARRVSAAAAVPGLRELPRRRRVVQRAFASLNGRARSLLQDCRTTTLATKHSCGYAIATTDTGEKQTAAIAKTYLLTYCTMGTV